MALDGRQAYLEEEAVRPTPANARSAPAGVHRTTFPLGALYNSVLSKAKYYLQQRYTHSHYIKATLT
jgi:hypothetical protein